MSSTHHERDHSGEGCKLIWTEAGKLSVPQALPQGSMLEVLHDAERELPRMLTESGSWRTLDIRHCTPHVERVFRKLGELWIALHCIYPCERAEALLHPHPWPSAMRILSGRYEMGIAYGQGNEMPPLAATTILASGSEYEMVDPNAWHYVRPLEGPALSIMVTGAKWDRSAPKNLEPLAELSTHRRDEMLETFRQFYTDSRTS